MISVWQENVWLYAQLVQPIWAQHFTQLHVLLQVKKDWQSIKVIRSTIIYWVVVVSDSMIPICYDFDSVYL